MDKQLENFLKNPKVKSYSNIYGVGYELVVIASLDESVLNWLRENEYPIAYASADGDILLKRRVIMPVGE